MFGLFDSFFESGVEMKWQQQLPPTRLDIDKSISLVASLVIRESSMGSNSEDENGVDKKPSAEATHWLCRLTFQLESQMVYVFGATKLMDKWMESTDFWPIHQTRRTNLVSLW